MSTPQPFPQQGPHQGAVPHGAPQTPSQQQDPPPHGAPQPPLGQSPQFSAAQHAGGVQPQHAAPQPPHAAPAQPAAPQQPASRPRTPTGTGALNPVSPAYVKVKLLGSAIGSGICVLVTAGAGVAGIIASLTWLTWLGFALAAAFVIGFVIEAVVTVRQVKAIGYLQRPGDLLIQRGILFRQTTVVPYGRLQYVEVSAGPLLRAAGLASLELHTASASTDASLPGLPRAEAEALRDSLAERGASKLAGL